MPLLILTCSYSGFQLKLFGHFTFPCLLMLAETAAGHLLSPVDEAALSAPRCFCCVAINSLLSTGRSPPVHRRKPKNPLWNPRVCEEAGNGL